MAKKFVSRFLLVVLAVSLIGALNISLPKKASAGYDPNNLCSDGAFANWASLDAAGIQAFLASKGSFLKNYSQNGRSAAQIIFDAAKSNKVNPIAILAMIQKEEGIIYGSNAGNLNQTRLDWAMGYGYTDSVIYEKYKGFTNQIDYGAWQLRRNFDYWATNGSVWNVGKSMVIDSTNVTFRNKCTSAQYRYTPHLGRNFNYYFNLWGGETTYGARYLGQGPRSGVGAWGGKILPNQSFTIWVNYRNTGSATWKRGGITPIHLGTADPQDRTSAFLGGKNLRGYLVQSTVAPGQIGTFKLSLRAPTNQGVYIEKFQPVVEHVGWIGDSANWSLNVTTVGIADKYKATIKAQGPYTGDGSYGHVIRKGDTFTVWINMKNTGSRTWYRMGDNPTHLATASPGDRQSPFLGNRSVRGYMVQSTVAPGQTGTFKIRLRAPTAAGKYSERFQLVTEYVGWFGPIAEWPLTVR